MRSINNILKKSFIAIVSVMIFTSCSDWLDLAPVDYFGSEGYWKTEEQVVGYMDGIHKHLRDHAFTHIFTFGELRSGIYETTKSADGKSVSSGGIIGQNFSEQTPQTTNFSLVFGRITNINLFIDRVTVADYISSEEKKNYLLAQAYGLRAFFYYDLYRTYGGVPLRLTVDVIDGELDPTKLYLKRSTPKEVMVQIKSDIDKSMELFGEQNGFGLYGQGKKAYWSKATTEALKADVYLWTSKVTTKWSDKKGSTEGTDVANPADIAVAKQALINLETKYGLGLETDFADVFDVNNKANDEVIFAIRYAEGEANNNNNNFVNNMATGNLQNDYLEDGMKFGDALGVKTTGAHNYEYVLPYFKMFDTKDTRRDATFLAAYKKSETGSSLTLFGTVVRKNIGYINSQGNRIYNGDYVLYRLAWVYLSLAEIANYEGNNADVVKYINMVRERAYGDDWSVATYGYTAGDFTTNELAILAERDKEFVQEGQRWWDIRRMTSTKGGDPLVFDARVNKQDNVPILDKATEEYKLLWPIDVTLLGSDPSLVQTPGYVTAYDR